MRIMKKIKKIKKIASILLALVMVLGLSTTVFAAGEGSITIDNPREGATYTAYKIFDVSYTEDKSSYAYTISKDSEWFGVVESYGGLNLTATADGTVYNVTETENYSAAAFANVLYNAVEGETAGTKFETKGNTATVTGLDLGYYFVTTGNGALCNLTTTDPTTTIHDKNDVPFEKVDDKESVEVGEVVTYTITSKVPDTTGFTSYTYKITDEMSDGLTFQNDVKITVGGTELAKDLYTLTINEAGTEFELTIDVMELQAQFGAEIKVTYTAVVNENAVAAIENNKAVLEYSNNPVDGTETTKTPEEIETVYSAKVVIDKYNAEDETKKLANAKFVLYKLDDEKKLYYKYNEETDTVSWVEDIAEATVAVTDENGAANFAGLKDGEYYLQEVEAPIGYNKLTEDLNVIISGTDATHKALESLVVTSKVANNVGSELPETGGIGTTIFYIVGAVMMILAVVVLVTRRRMK